MPTRACVSVCVCVCVCLCVFCGLVHVQSSEVYIGIYDVHTDI